MDFETIGEGFFWTLFTISLAIPAWLVFYPPTRIKSWPSILRPLLALVFAQAAIYAMYYCWIYPALFSYLRGHPGALLDGLLVVPPIRFLPIPAVAATVFYTIRTCFLVYRRRSDDEPPSPDTRLEL